ncbi:MAG TPA: hypothetical protein O0X73_00440 [Methanocorpusculum sp.]|nr:hypothetical protein [Methanocorpusculum sp.]
MESPINVHPVKKQIMEHNALVYRPEYIISCRRESSNSHNNIVGSDYPH